MKKISMFLWLICLTLLFSGCPNPNSKVVFGDYHTTDDFDDASVMSSLNFEFGIAKSYEGYYFNVTNPVSKSNFGVSKGTSPNGKDVIGGCVKVEMSSSYPGTKINKDKYYVYTVRTDFSPSVKQQYRTKTFNYSVNIYKDKTCSKIVGSYQTKDFKFSGTVPIPAPSPITKVLNAIGGESQYCNIDMNGNLNVLNTNNLFVNIAYSQVGYKEKATNKAIDSCTQNAGNKNYQKYGNNGQAWSSHFVHWIFDKAQIKNNIPTSITAMVDWAKSNNRWTTNRNSMNSGDLVVLSTNSGSSGLTVGIVYKETNQWYVILGNWNESVVAKPLNNINQYAKFYGVINLKGLTY